MGEKFAANPVTGTGSMTVPIALSSGRSGFGPQLALAYDSGAGNGPFGFGWSLSIPSVGRKTDKGLPKYIDEPGSEPDVVILSGAEDLVPVLEPDGRLFEDDTTAPGYTIHRYRPRIEGLFARIERWTRRDEAARDGDVHWRSISRENILTIYGKDEHSRIADPDDPGHIFTWLICESRDDKGNAILYEYKPEDGAGVDLSRSHERNRGDRGNPGRTANRYLKRIRYGNRTPLLDDAGQRPRFLTELPPERVENAGWMFELVFDYGEHDVEAPTPHDVGQWACRADPFSSCRAGFEVRSYRLCQRALMFHHFEQEQGVGNDCLVRSTDFTYSHEPNPDDARNPVYSFLLSVIQSGYKREGGGYLKRSLPPAEFEYTEPIVQDRVEEIDAQSLENLPVGLDGGVYQWTDLHGEGIPGILTEQANAWFYKRNLSPISERPVEFAPLERVLTRPNFALGGGQAQFMDLAGDGQPDLVVLDDLVPGLYEHDGAEGWQAFRPFTSRLNRDSRDPSLKFVDLDGDGHADVLITEDDAFIWHASLAEAGFGPARRVAQALDEEKGPRLVFTDSTQAIYLADLSGDGLTDLARIRNGEICYWPNLGYGRFGAKVTMDHAPLFDHPDRFDHQRIRLADIDGSGATDVIYLHRDGVRLYFNQSGNGWSAPRSLRVFPCVDDLAAITPTDLLGNGTACLVWSSPLPGDSRRQMRYVDLMGGQKPHLLVSAKNNLGAETQVHYAPSTKFYLGDKRHGKPWITRLPFPVHVVERVETYDHISRNHFVSRYAYHHGYFDGIEREFRGFGMVEQWDTEAFAALGASDDFPAGDNIDTDSHVPPVHTRTWFHTGAYLGRDHISNFFAGLADGHDRGEYYREPAWLDDDDEARKRLLDDTVLPPGLTIEEEREACRALKGSMLRQEVYALDGTGSEDYPSGHPYTVTEQNFTIRRLQPKAGNRHAVFFAHAREAISTHYERKHDPADPRVSHVLTLEVDKFGNVLRSLAVAYPRANVPERQPEQNETHLSLALNRFANRDDRGDWYRVGLPVETRTCEVVKPPAATRRFTWKELGDLVTALVPLDRHEPPLVSTVAYEQWDWRKQWNPQTEPGGLVNGESVNTRLRLIEHVRTLYRKNDLTELLPLGEIESLALPGESYKLAFTPELIRQIFVESGKLTEPELNEVLADEGKYVHSEGDGNWWIPSGRIFYSPDSNDAPTKEADHARAHFFLPHRSRDPFHTAQVSTETLVTYDDHKLLLARTQDAVGNTITTLNDYRVLQPRLVTDPNRNRAEVAFDTLGMVVGTAMKGKDDGLGDTLSGFEPDLTQAQADEFHDVADPRVPAPGLLKGATTRVIYDLDRFRRTRQAHPGDPTQWLPGYAATLARETHASDPLPPQGLRIQISLSYSDGFGREIQKKIQAEPGPLVEGGPVVSPRWVGSGWTIFNNKGKPVRQYEPFFSQLPEKRHRFEFGVRAGVSPILFYDPVERVVATLHPNHSYEKVVFDPWRQTTYDVNDTVAANGTEAGDPRTDADIKDQVAEYFKTQPDAWQTWHQERITGAKGVQEKSAAEKAAKHANTPTTAHFDTLGRPFLTLAHNGFEPDGTTPVQFPTRVQLDIEGNQRAVLDAKDRVVMRYDYDLLGNRIHQASMEAGERWMLNDVSGKPIRAWDSRGHAFRTAYDPLRRPLRSFVTGADPTDPSQELLTECLIYGEQHPEDELRNLRGALYLHLDQAGVVTNEAHDFKGNPLRATRRLARAYKQAISWSGIDATLPANATTKLDLGDLQADLASLLEAEIYTSRTTYDAVNRPVQIIAPRSDQPGAKRNVIQPGYNEANLLERVDVWLDHSTEPTGLLDGALVPPSPVGVNNIDYDAKGQRLRIEYKNGASTRYAYDPETFRLIHLYTRRGAAFTQDCENPQPPPPTIAAPEKPPEGSQCGLQNLHYSYDAAGNITHLRDDAQQTIYFDGQVVPPHCDYTYDAVYRLIRATGREHIGQGGQPQTTWNDEFRVRLQHPGDGQAMRNYTEAYEYDAVGNFEKLIHQAANGGWTRSYAYNEASLIEPAKKSNRLSSTTVGNNAPEPYTYDAHGNMTKMPHLSLMQWDYQDQLQATSKQVVNNGGTPEKTWYVYDAGGQRVRKVTERQAAAGQTPTRMKERIYLGGFEIYREYRNNGDTVTLERETLHIMDDQQRIALVETRTQGTEPSVPPQLIRYQFGNHLGSTSLELDDQAQIISYEEYYPYGGTSYQLVRSQTETPKRYRFTGMERDEETGFAYHEARYYVPWLGRWTNADPADLEDGSNLFVYARNRPSVFHDQDGRQSRKVAPPDKRRGITFSSESKISALEMLTKIKASKKLDPWMKKVFGVQGNRLYAKKSFSTPKGATVPKWFQLFVNTARSNTVHVTTGKVNMTQAGVRLLGDFEAGDLPGSMVSIGAGKKTFIADPNIPDKYADARITLGRWDVSMMDEFAGWDGKNSLRSVERKLVVIGNRQVFEKTTLAIDDEKILETFFHEVAAHQGVHDDIEFNEPKVSATDRMNRSIHSAMFAEHGLLGASATDSDRIAQEVENFFGGKLDRTLYEKAKKAFTPKPSTVSP